MRRAREAGGPQSKGRRTLLRRALSLVAGFFLCAPAAQGDYAVLRNGQRLRITGLERQGDTVRLRIPGGELLLPTAQLVAVEPEEIFPAIAQPALDVPYADLILSAARRHGMDPLLVASVIAAESSFDARAVSRKQARGLMQLMPETAARFAVADVFDPRQNIEAGTRYLRELLDRFQENHRLALAAYHAGPERIEQHRGVPPFPETEAYVARVLDDWQARRGQRNTQRAVGAAREATASSQ